VRTTRFKAKTLRPQSIRDLAVSRRTKHPEVQCPTQPHGVVTILVGCGQAKPRRIFFTKYPTLVKWITDWLFKLLGLLFQLLWLPIIGGRKLAKGYNWPQWCAYDWHRDIIKMEGWDFVTALELERKHTLMTSHCIFEKYCDRLYSRRFVSVSVHV